MSDFTYSILSSPLSTHSLTLNVYRPAKPGVPEQLYKTFGTDTATGVGDFTSMPMSKGLDKTQSSVTAILNVALPDRLIYSRQMVGWRAEIVCNSFDGTTTGSRLMYNGLVSGASVKGSYTALELVNQTSRLNSIPPIILSNNCPLIFGSPECGLVKAGEWVQPLSIVGNVVSFVPYASIYFPNPNFVYSAEVGDLSYAVQGFNEVFPGTVDQVILQNAPVSLPDWMFISLSCNQTLQQCRNYNNTTRYRGSVLPRNPLNFR